MPVYIHRPHTVLPAHKVTTAEIVDDILAHHPDHPRRAVLPRVMTSLKVNTRYFTRPLAAPTVSGDADVEQRATAAFADALEMATAASTRALECARLSRGPDGYADIDAIITTHSTGWSVPNMDIHLIGRLGLKPTVRRIAMTTMACAGGTQALIRAVDHVTAHP
ncbi:PhlD, partial [Streptomyces roseoviridis]